MKFKPFNIKPDFIKKYWFPDSNFKMKKYKTNSWFSNLKYEIEPVKFKIKNKNKNPIKIKITHNAELIIIYPTIKQKNIILKWLDAYRCVYNIGIYFTRTKKSPYNFYKLRKKTNSYIKNNKFIMESNIPVHIRDQALNDVCKAYKSALENFTPMKI